MIVPSVETSNNPHLAELVQLVNASQAAIGLTVDGEEKAVLLSAKAFRHLLGLKVTEQQNQLSWEEFSQQFQQAMVETEYNTPEKILQLVREIKQELAAERDQRRVAYSANIELI